jgi:very-short-patch-repair endonuclease
VSSVPRLLVELAPRETPEELRRLIELSVRRRLLDISKVEQLLHRYTGWPGLLRLREALEGYSPTPVRRSGLERAFDQILEELVDELDLPDPRRNSYLHGWELDCYWPELKLVVELDGSQYHRTVDDLERDRVKDAYLLTLGIRTLRFTEFRVEHDRDGIKADFAAVVRSMSDYVQDHGHAEADQGRGPQEEPPPRSVPPGHHSGDGEQHAARGDHGQKHGHGDQQESISRR